MKLFVEVVDSVLSVFTHWDTLALWWSANTETKKNETEYLRLKTESNRIWKIQIDPALLLANSMLLLFCHWSIVGVSGIFAKPDSQYELDATEVTE